MFKAFGRVSHANFLHKLKSNGIKCVIFGTYFIILGNMQLPVVWDGKSWQVYSIINACICWGSILGHKLFMLYINDLPNDAICINILMVLFSAIYLKFIYFKSPGKSM